MRSVGRAGRVEVATVGREGGWGGAFSGRRVGQAAGRVEARAPAGTCAGVGRAALSVLAVIAALRLGAPELWSKIAALSSL